MERENSSFFTDGVKDKPASVKMDLEICELYHKAIEVLLCEEEYENSIKDIRRFLLLFIHLQKSLNKKQKSSKKVVPNKQLCELKQILFYRILYIYWNSTCFSSAVALHFRKFLVGNPLVLKELKSKKIIRICSLGGGCLSDVIAMVKVLESRENAEKRMDIRVSVVDTDKKWMITCFTILQRLEHFFNATWKIDFTQADLTKPLSDFVQEMIKTADIVSMVMFLSEVKDATKQQKILPMVRKLMQPGSILFFVDYSKPSLITALEYNSVDLSKYNLLYKSTSELHTLDESVLDRVFRLYYDKFHLSQFCTHITVTTRVWRRSSGLDAQNIANLICQKEKLAEMEKNLAKNKILIQKVTKEIQLLQKYRIESIKYWIIIFNNEKKERWWNKKQIRKIIRPEEDFINIELQKKRSLLETLKKDIGIEEQKLKNLQSYLSKHEKVYTVANSKEGKIEANDYENYVVKLMRHLKQKYSVYSKYKVNDRSGRHLVVSETLFAHR
ncbi:UNVERIFIED_CONTAM: hypothetical protein NCL1_48804 [Trichonephila clavipes]